MNQFTHPLFKDIDKNELIIYSTKFLIYSEWTFVTYDGGCEVLKIKKELDKDGFIFNEEENQEWKEYVSEDWNNVEEQDLVDNKNYEKFKVLYKEVFNEPFIIKPYE